MQLYTVIVHKEEDEDYGGYWAEVAELPGCMAAGDTLEELEEDVRGAIETYINVKRQLGEEVPAGRASAEGWQLSVAVA
jgi:predicted RNase H-like HicB family nuclease